MTSSEIRKRFIDFFQKRGHAVIPSASLVPENDQSVLFNTAGMQPLVPYLSGKEHPQGKRLVNIQKCVRTQDIDEVGDSTHDTFFEMMGNWSLGDYWKEEAIQWSYEFLTSKEEGLGLNPKRLYITVFGGNSDVQKDEESFDIWKKYIPENRIYFLTWNGKKEPNWWDLGENGPCGPDTEMFYDITEDGLGDLTLEEYIKADEEQKVVEIWNDVFMQYMKKDGKVAGELPKKNVDTGGGLERIAMAVQGKNNIFATDLFDHLLVPIRHLDPVSGRSSKIVADHIRTSVFMISDGVLPSNIGRGYILRRLLRRAYVYSKKIGADLEDMISILTVVVGHISYKNIYHFDLNKIKEVLSNEISKFEKTIDAGLKQFEKLSGGFISGTDAFLLFSTYGFPIEMTEELAKQKNILVDKVGFNIEMKKHQELSRVGSEQKFKVVLE